MHFSNPFNILCGVTITFLTGCAQQPNVVDTPTPPTHVVTTEQQVIIGPNPPIKGTVAPDIYHQSSNRIEVLRTSRYQLVAMQTPLEQRELLEQVVNVHIPPSAASTSVGDAIRFTLRNTGYSLCHPTQDHQKWLFSRPLPAVHYHLGPIALREALQVLAGDAWELIDDPVKREVCYEQRDLRTVKIQVEVPDDEMAEGQHD